MSTIQPEPTVSGSAQPNAAQPDAMKPEPAPTDTTVSETLSHAAEAGETTLDPRTLALIILTVLALLFALQWARKFLIPIVFGIFISYTLNPVVDWLERIRIPRLIGTSVVIAAIFLGAGAAGNTLQLEFRSILNQLPEAAHKISRTLVELQDGQPSTVQQVQQAADELEKATTGRQEAGREGAGKKQPAPDTPVFKVTEWIWVGSMSVVGFIADTVMVLFLVFFLLLAGDSFKRKLVKIAGNTLSQKKIAVHILDDIHTSIQSYMFMLLVTNSLLALLMWITFRLIGLENAGAWAVAAGLFHLIPYFGPLLITITSGVTAFMQFGSLYVALLVAGCSLTIATLIGIFVTTWMVGKIARMNAAAVFIGLLFWGWMWGVWGLLLGIPIIVIVKIVADNLGGSMESISELLAE